LTYLLLTKPLVRRIAAFLLIAAFASLFLIHLCGEQQIDFFLIGDNFRELFFAHSAGNVLSKLTLDQAMLFADAVVLAAAMALFTNWFAVWPLPRWPRGQTLATAVLLIAIVATPLYRHNDLTYFARTAIDYAFGQYTYPGVAATEEFPFVQRTKAVKAPADQPEQRVRPHVFIITLESFNWNFAETRTPDDREYTPFFNSLIDQGLYIERCYGNSIQSCRGQLSALCSILDGMHGKVFTSYPELRLQSIAEILRRHGYRTIFMQSQQSLEYDKTGAFMLRNGFDEAYGMEGSLITEADRPYLWGWGMQDDRMYQKLFQVIDKPSTHSKTSQPVFAFLATTSHHWPFDRMPADQRYLYPNPSDGREKFANSIYLADRYLKKFFDLLHARPELANNSLILLTGDHSFPAGEHGGFYNEQGFYEENFRIPMLILWNGRIAPGRIKEGAFSQLDIPPTLLDLLKIETDHHFQGRSMLDPQVAANRAVTMIQPYDGTYICVVRYPLKYVQGVRVPGKYLFNLRDDPREERNLVDEFDGTDVLAQLQDDVLQVYFNQFLIERNRIWPANP
jgi:arylsulfatase A-like enzyme